MQASVSVSKVRYRAGAEVRTWVPSAASLSSSARMHFMRSVAYSSGSRMMGTP